MVSEKEKENREKLFRLMRENPELPVVAMVDSEIVADDGYNRWLGVWGCSYIGEYLIGEEHLFFREDDDPSEVDRVLSERYGDDYLCEVDYCNTGRKLFPTQQAALEDIERDMLKSWISKATDYSRIDSYTVQQLRKVKEILEGGA